MNLITVIIDCISRILRTFEYTIHVTSSVTVVFSYLSYLKIITKFRVINVLFSVIIYEHSIVSLSSIVIINLISY